MAQAQGVCMPEKKPWKGLLGGSGTLSLTADAASCAASLGLLSPAWSPCYRSWVHHLQHNGQEARSAWDVCWQPGYPVAQWKGRTREEALDWVLNVLWRLRQVVLGCRHCILGRLLRLCRHSRLGSLCCVLCSLLGLVAACVMTVTCHRHAAKTCGVQSLAVLEAHAWTIAA